MLKPYVSRVTDEIADRLENEGMWSGDTLADRLDWLAGTSGEIVAVSDDHDSLTYGELHAEARVLARRLAGSGVGPTWVVGLLGGPIADFVTLHHAIIRTGAVTLPLSERLRQRELAALLEIADIDVLIVPSAPYESADGTLFDFAEVVTKLVESLRLSVRVLVYGQRGGFRSDVQAIGDLEPTGLLPCLSARSDYLMMPSAGTTGTPKLHLRCHNSWLAMADNRAERLGRTIRNDGTLLCLANPTQGVGYMNGVLLPLVAEGLSIRFSRVDAEAALDLISSSRPVAIAALPVHYSGMEASGAYDTADLSSLEVMISGGGPFHPAARQAWEVRAECPMILAYGASDVGLVASPSVTDRSDTRWNTVGRPLRDSEVRILDAAGVEVPEGDVGEIAVRGPDIVSAGYGMELPEPDDAGFIRLGDLGFLGRDGHLRVTGRLTDMIVRGGQNVSATYVQSLVEGHPLVTEAVVVGIPDDHLGEITAALVVLAPGCDNLARDVLSSYLRELGVAAHHIPDAVVPARSVPRTASGKVNQAAAREKVLDALVHVPE